MGGDGGSFYFETFSLNKLTLLNTIIDGSTAVGNGGVFYVKIMENAEILISGSTKIKNFKVANTDLGSMFYSGLEPSVQLTIENSFITCNTSALWTDAIAAIIASKSYQAGAIYMENSLKGVVSSNNLYSKCSSS